MQELFFIFGAKYLFILSLVIVGTYFLRSSVETRKKLVMFLIISLPLTYLAGLSARQLYFNPRPFVVGNYEPLIPHEADNGFPSDHVLLVSSLGAAMLFFNRRIALWLWLVAGVVALSRVYAGVHHSSDVWASMALALLCAIIVNKFYARQ